MTAERHVDRLLGIGVDAAAQVAGDGPVHAPPRPCAVAAEAIPDRQERVAVDLAGEVRHVSAMLHLTAAPLALLTFAALLAGAARLAVARTRIGW